MSRILVTTSRMPFALDEIRKLGRSGHRIWACDTFAAAPGNHSRWVNEPLVLPSPRYDTAAYIAALVDVVRTRDIELLVPGFEDVFYIARHRDRIARHTEIFAPSFDTLAKLHDKSRFLALAAGLGLAVPRGWTVTTRAELALAARELGEFFARPVYSRGGVMLCTNVGPLAGTVPIERCDPTPSQPWLVQEFVRGTEICTLSVVHHGCVAAHSTYVHPRTIEHSGGISFVSIPEGGTLDVVRRIAGVVGYHGQISLDFIRTDRGLVLIECNPRPSGGVYMMSDDMFDDALMRPRRGPTRCAPSGIARKVGIALLREAVSHRFERMENLRALFSPAPDVYADPRDPLPMLWVLLSYGHVLAYRWRAAGLADRRTQLLAAYFHDVLWDGEPIAEVLEAEELEAAI